MRHTGILAAAAALAAALLGVPAGAHDGEGCEWQIVPAAIRFEGECYLTEMASVCDPDIDGEHTRVVADAGFSSGEAARIPRSGCGLTFDRMFFPPGRFVSVRACPAGTGVLKVNVEVILEGARVAFETFDATGGQCTVAPFTDNELVAPGNATLQVAYGVVGAGRYDIDVDLDYLDYLL